MAEEIKVTPAYVPWKTFFGSFAAIEKACPDPLDHSVWGSQSGGTRSALIVAYKYLGLVDENRMVQPVLRELLSAKEADRAPIIKRTLEERYPKIVALGSGGASPSQLEQARGELGVEGSTRRKAISFYVSAAEYAGVPLSPHWADKRKRPGGAGGASRPRKARASKRITDGSRDASLPPPPPPKRDQYDDLYEATGGLVRALIKRGSDWNEDQARDWMQSFQRAVRLEYPAKPVARRPERRTTGGKKPGIGVPVVVEEDDLPFE